MPKLAPYVPPKSGRSAKVAAGYSVHRQGEEVQGASWPLAHLSGMPAGWDWSPSQGLAYEQVMGQEALERQLRAPFEGKEVPEGAVGPRLAAIINRLLREASEGRIALGPVLPRASRAPQLVAAVRFLEALLADGEWHPAAQIKTEAAAAGHSWRTVKRAKKLLGIESREQVFSGPWFWRLPPVVWLPAKQAMRLLRLNRKKEHRTGKPSWPPWPVTYASPE
jgi:hypothetical protein